MARKLVSDVADSDRYSKTEESGGESGDTEAADGLLNRREYVKLGAAAAGAVAVALGHSSENFDESKAVDKRYRVTVEVSAASVELV